MERIEQLRARGRAFMNEAKACFDEVRSLEIEVESILEEYKNRKREAKVT